MSPNPGFTKLLAGSRSRCSDRVTRMRRVAAPLAAVVLALLLGGCGGGGAEPGAPQGATLILDFQPNAVHSGIYAAQAKGFFKDEGVDLTIRAPSSTADSAKLLEAGRADFAVMDINDFGIARERGLDLVAIAAIVQRPLASVIARDRNAIRTPADLAGKTVGVTGVPSDDAVLNTVLRSGGVNPSSVHRVDIGFNAVSALAAGKIDAATAFWNAEGVQLQQMGIPIRELRVDEFGAPRYPELVVATTPERCDLANRLSAGLQRGYETMTKEPQAALRDLLDEVPDLDPGSQSDQLQALLGAHAFSVPGANPVFSSRLMSAPAISWTRWAARNGVISAPSVAQVSRGFSEAACS